jgi:hypothetical protein
MRSTDQPSSKQTASPGATAGQRGLVAARAMAKAVEENHKRWGLPLLTWKDGKVVEVKP